MRQLGERTAGPACLDFPEIPMASTPPARLERDAPSESNGRNPPLHVLFVHCRAREVERCLKELRKVHFTVSGQTVSSLQEFGVRLASQSYDLVVAEQPGHDWPESQTLELLHLSKSKIPLIFLGGTLHPETVAEFITRGAYDCIEMGHISHLPVAVRRALNEKSLRDELDQARNCLRHSEARYRALAGNLTYGILHCDVKGKFLEVNEAMVKMFGYASKAELLTLTLRDELIQDPSKRAQLLGQSTQQDFVDPMEIDWLRKDGTTLKVRLSGQEVRGEQGELNAYEVIFEDVTKQRQLEDHLRQQAARDPLTGLSNFRRLTEVLDCEIKRSGRTGRDFALLLFDLDGLKRINDRYGHMTGSHALCRVADVLSFCRDIDTAARYGGDEFAVVLPETGAEAAAGVADRICNAIANDGMRPKLSVSVGVAIYPRDGERIEALVRTADVAMYEMKARKYKVFDTR